MITKNDIIQDAYLQIRISGITVSATPGDIELALMRLESMMAEFDGRTMCIGYLFEDEPQGISSSGIKLTHKQMAATNLGIRLLPDFGKEIPQVLMLQASQSYTASSAVVARERTRQVLPSSRMPRGSGNRYFNRWNRYFPVPEIPNVDCDSEMFIGEIDDLYESFSAYLEKNSGSITSFTIDITAGIQLIAEREVQADGGFDTPCGQIWTCTGSASISGSLASLPGLSAGVTQSLVIIPNVDYRVEVVNNVGASLKAGVGSNESVIPIGDTEVIVNSGQALTVADNSFSIVANANGTNDVSDAKLFQPLSYSLEDKVYYRLQVLNNARDVETVTVTVTTSTGRISKETRKIRISRA